MARLDLPPATVPPADPLLPLTPGLAGPELFARARRHGVPSLEIYQSFMQIAAAIDRAARAVDDGRGALAATGDSAGSPASRAALFAAADEAALARSSLVDAVGGLRQVRRATVADPRLAGVPSIDDPAAIGDPGGPDRLWATIAGEPATATEHLVAELAGPLGDDLDALGAAAGALTAGLDKAWDVVCYRPPRSTRVRTRLDDAGHRVLRAGKRVARRLVPDRLRRMIRGR